MTREAKLDLQAIRIEAIAARERIKQLPVHTQEMIRIVYSAACSPESLQTLSDINSR